MVFRCRDLGKDRSTRPAWKMFMQWMPHSPSILVSRMEKPASKDTSLNVGDPRPSCLKESPHAGSAPQRLRIRSGGDRLSNHPVVHLWEIVACTTSGQEV